QDHGRPVPRLLFPRLRVGLGTGDRVRSPDRLAHVVLPLTGSRPAGERAGRPGPRRHRDRRVSPVLPSPGAAGPTGAWRRIGNPARRRAAVAAGGMAVSAARAGAVAV